MPGFYYYFPNVTAEQLSRNGQLNREILASAGVDELLADVVRVPQHAAVCDVHKGRGPGGTSGVVLGISTRHGGSPPHVGNFPDRQKWIPREDLQRAAPVPAGQPIQCYLGWLETDPPASRDLERWAMVPGYTVNDAHNYEWQIPVGRSPREGFEYGTLPQSYLLADGEAAGVLQPSYQWLWELSGRIRDWYRNDDGPAEGATPEEIAQHQRPPFGWLVVQAARLLAVNYRVGHAELNALHRVGREVLTQATVHAICQASFDWQIVDEAKKKPDPSLTESPTGPPQE